MPRKRTRFSRMPPRHLPGEWPVEMRADVVAAFLDYPDTRALAVAIEMGDAPRCAGRERPLSVPKTLSGLMMMESLKRVE